MRFFLAIAMMLALLAVSATVGADPRGYEIIVNPVNDVGSVERQFLADAFLKKATTWPGGDVIHPVDLPASSRVRHQFTEEILRRSISEVKGYWQQRIFSGRDVPPPELDNDDAVVAYVLKHGGAVGYVSVGATLNGAKVLAVR